MERDRGETLHRLWSFTARACGDPVFRRELRYHPRLAFARAGLGWEAGVPDELPIRHYEVSVEFEEALLFGRPWAEGESCGGWPWGAEGKLALARVKPLVLEHGTEDRMERLAVRLRREGMKALLSPYEFVPASESSKGGYSNLTAGQGPARSGSGRWRSLVAGWEPERVEMAWLCLLFGWDEFLGRLLGYPACCSAAFARAWPEARQNHGGEVANVMLRRLPRAWAGGFGWETNIFGRYLGVEAIQHFPCDLNCAETVRLARRNQKVLAALWPEDAGQLNRLAAPVLYTEQAGVFLFPGASVEETDGGGATMSFEAGSVVSTQPEGELAKSIDACGGRLAADGRRVVVGDSSLDGWLMDFSREPGEPLAPEAAPAAQGKERLYEILLPPGRRAG
jgi:hypothetical protein